MMNFDEQILEIWKDKQIGKGDNKTVSQLKRYICSLSLFNIQLEVKAKSRQEAIKIATKMINPFKTNKSVSNQDSLLLQLLVDQKVRAEIIEVRPELKSDKQRSQKDNGGKSNE